MGTPIGGYTVVKTLAAGARTDNELARAVDRDGYVVLKRIRAEHAADALAIGMYLGEARAAATVVHKNVVQVHDVVQDAGEYAIVKDYVHGQDLRTVLATASRRGQRVPVDYAIAIASAVASGLHFAHERRSASKRPLGIVHRNLAPSNILIGYDGAIKCTDFGALRPSPGTEGPAEPPGRGSYLSPEQCTGGEVDRRTDVYALGVVLYELATTTRLFTGGDAEVIEQIVHGQVESPEVRRPGLSSELAAVILRAIAPDPDERYATCNELRIALDQIAGKTVRPTPAALAGYLREQFGEPLEPWLSPGGSAAGAAVPVSTNTWTETPSGEAQARGVSRPIPTAGLGDIAPPDGAPVRHSTSGVLGEVELAAPLHASPVESLAGEAASSPTARRTRPRAARAGAYGAPIVLIAGIAVWRLAGTGGASAQVSVAPRVEPSAAATEPAPGESATSLGTQVIAVARDPAPRMPGAAAAPPPAARPPPAVTVKSRSAAAAPHHEAVAATTPAAPRLAEPEPAAPAAAEHPALASLPQVAAPLPLAVPAAPVAPMVIAPQALDANRIAGVHDIAPDSATELQIQRSGTDRVVASFQLCVSPDGSVSGVTAVRSTGFAAFDAKITTAIRETWRYRPFLVDGAPATVCSKVNFGYAPKP